MLIVRFIAIYCTVSSGGRHRLFSFAETRGISKKVLEFIPSTVPIRVPLHDLRDGIGLPALGHSRENKPALVVDEHDLVL
jgi:hypothetical protein